MNRILGELCAIANRERARWLPKVTDRDLEKGGALFYMNGQNGSFPESARRAAWRNCSRSRMIMTRC